MDPLSEAAQPRAIAAFLGLLAFHVAHVFEEIYGRFVALHKLGLAGFLAANWALFCVPIVILYFWLRGRRWALRLSAVYAGFMVLNGLGHIVMTLATGRYLDGYAGGLSGFGLIVTGGAFLGTLRSNRSRSRPEGPAQ
jgi:hypothetical protein